MIGARTLVGGEPREVIGSSKCGIFFGTVNVDATCPQWSRAAGEGGEETESAREVVTRSSISGLSNFTYLS